MGKGAAIVSGQLNMFAVSAPTDSPRTTSEGRPELGTMRALTLWRPWPHSILRGDKRIENRPWPCPKALIGQLIAIHAGKKWDAARELDILEELDLDEWPPEALAEGIVGVARVVDVVRTEAELDGMGLSAKWFFGPFGWVLADVRALKEPIPIRGAQGLWRVPLTIQKRIEEEVAHG